MSSYTINILNLVSINIYIYGSICIIVIGIFSNIINTVLFSSKNYRTHPCSLYFVTTEVSNLISLLIYALPITIDLITGHNGTETYAWWCKLTNYFGNILIALSIITLCLASIDRYHSTSRSVRRRERSSMKVAKISILTAVFVSFLLAIPELLYRNIDNSFGIPMCIASSAYYLYLTFFFNPVYILLPIILLSVFGFLTYRNIKNVQHFNSVAPINTINLATTTFTVSNIGNVLNNYDNINVIMHQRQKQNKKIATNKQRMDRQFSIILIIHVLYYSVTTVPSGIQLIYSMVTKNYVKSDLTMAIEGLFAAIIYVMSCAPFSSTFYIYYLLSPAYRKNVKKIFCKQSEIRT